jgi:hypothetical protein
MAAALVSQFACSCKAVPVRAYVLHAALLPFLSTAVPALALFVIED